MVSEGTCEEGILPAVKDYIMKHSEGVFLWVTLTLRHLEQYIGEVGYTEMTLMAKLRSLPRELGGKDGFYRAMVNSLVEKHKDNQEQQELGRRILAWVTFAERPVSITELQDALAAPSGPKSTDLSTYVLEKNRRNHLDRAILSSCGGLVEVRDLRSDQIVQLIHQTAREFLLHEDKFAEPYRLEEFQGDMEIAIACGRYISIVFRQDIPPVEANPELPDVKVLAKHLSSKSLLVYALEYFQTHLNRLGSNGEKVRDEFKSFVKHLTERSNSYASLLLWQWIETLGWLTKLHVDDTSARLFLHSLLLSWAQTSVYNETILKRERWPDAAAICRRELARARPPDPASKGSRHRVER
ncbi:hypothetical protein F5X98DRAFT_311661 [Xylaria grammica]|nr:hypothetical protein F5X98DRAFT_311661 [Xylaria grammica]